MNDEHSRSHETPAPAVGTAIKQTPPDVKVIIAKADGTPLIKMVAIGPTAPGTGYSADREYWRTAATNVLADFDVDSLRFTFEKLPAGYTESDIDAFFGTWTTNAIVSPRVGVSWIPRRRADIVGRSVYLFAMPDPESPHHNVGILMELADSGSYPLRAVAYYKTWSPPSGEVFPARATSFVASLTRAKTAANAVSTDPVDMVLINHVVMQ